MPCNTTAASITPHTDFELRRPRSGFATTEPAVVVVLRKAGPPLGSLAADKGFSRLPLGVQGIEIEIQAFLGRFPGVNGTADDRLRGLRFGLIHRLASKLKKRNPLQCEPLISLAAADSEVK